VRLPLLAAAAALAGCGGHVKAPAPPTTMTWPALDTQFLAAHAQTFGFNLGLPSVEAIAPDGNVLFRRTPPRSFVADLYQLDAKTGKVMPLATADGLLGGGDEHLSDADKARRERTRTATRGIVDLGLSDDGARLLVPLGSKMFVVERADGKAHAVDVGGYPYDPRLAPDGSRIAYVHDGDLYVVAADPAAGAAPAPVRLTTRPGPDVSNGVAEFVAQEELDRTRGFWWSPDGSRLLYQHTDQSKVETSYVADPLHPERPPVPFKYPRPGQANADVRLGLIAAGGGDTTWVDWDRARYPYLADVAWPEHGPLTLVVLDRDQYDLAVLAVDVATGKTTPLVTEHDDAWINVPNGAPRWLDDGSGFLWMSERTGEWQLELRDAHGALVRTLTPAGFGLRGLGGVDRARGVAWVTASADPKRADVWLVPLDGQRHPQMVTHQEGVWGVKVGKTGAIGVAQGSLLDGTVATIALRSDGTTVAEIPSAAERPPHVPHPAFEEVVLEGRHYQTAIVRPRDFDPTRRYPVLLKVYAGPHVRTVLAAARTYFLDQWYADAGFVVVRVDGRGTPNQGRDWERATIKDLITLPLKDQVDVLAELGSRHPEMDMQRVGVFGWSFGGYFSTMAVLLRPDVFRCGIAGAPVIDWGLYDTAYTERYMKQPAENADGYQRTSALTYADKLERPLLIIHGLTDDNVHLANSLAMVEALFAAGKRADFVPLSSTHMVPDPAIALARERLQVDFLRAHLAP